MTTGHSEFSSIAWCGPRCDGLQWLHQQFAEAGQLDAIEELSCDAVDELCGCYPRRLVISVDSRLDYPQAVIDHLRRKWPDIPWALAVSTWFDGGRRTSIGNVNHLQWAWYRWWDCWFPWLESSHADLLGPFPRLSSLLAADILLPTIPPGIVVGECRQTMDGWRQSIQCTHDRLPDESPIVGMTQLQFANWLNDECNWSEAMKWAAWLLWDDTCVGGRDDAESMKAMCDLFQRLHTRLPTCRLIIATSMPRWHDWQLWQQYGAHDLIAKPCIGSPLARILANTPLISH